MANVFEPTWDEEQDRGPFRWRRARVGRQAGARQLGASIYDLPAGASTWPMHIHHANEELIVVLAGRPTLRTPDGERELEPGEIVACPVGREGGHRIDNRGGEPARVLVVSTMIAPELSEYPDSGKVMAVTLAPGGVRREHDITAISRPSESLDYFDGEEA